MKQTPSLPSLGQRLRYLRKLKGLSQADLAVRAGCTQGAIGNIERNLRIGRGETLMNIAEVLGVPYRWLKEGGGSFELGEHRSMEERRFSKETNGSGHKVMGLEHVPDWLKRRARVDHAREPSGHQPLQSGVYLVGVSGDSMTQAGKPNFPDGCILHVSSQRNATSGDYVIALDPSHTHALFRQLLQEGGDWYLKPLNSDYRTIRLESLDEQVVGVVTEYWYGGSL